jgi:hypothetical protein
MYGALHFKLIETTKLGVKTPTLYCLSGHQTSGTTERSFGCLMSRYTPLYRKCNDMFVWMKFFLAFVYLNIYYICFKIIVSDCLFLN